MAARTDYDDFLIGVRSTNWMARRSTSTDGGVERRVLSFFSPKNEANGEESLKLTNPRLIGAAVGAIISLLTFLIGLGLIIGSIVFTPTVVV